MRAVNLLPAEQRKGAGGPYGRSDGAAYVVVGFAAALCVLGVLWGMAHRTIDSDRVQSQALVAQAADVSLQASRLAPYESFISLSQQRQQAVAVLATSRFDWAHAFHELGRVLPSDVALISVTGGMTAAVPSVSATVTTTTTTTTTDANPPVTAANSVTPPGSVPTMSLQACATSQAEVALALQRLQLMDGVQTVSLVSSATGSASSASSVAAQPVSGTSSSASSGAPYCPDSFVADISFQPLPTAMPTAPTSDPAGAVTTVSASTTTTVGGS